MSNHFARFPIHQKPCPNGKNTKVGEARVFQKHKKENPPKRVLFI